MNEGGGTRFTSFWLRAIGRIGFPIAAMASGPRVPIRQAIAIPAGSRCGAAQPMVGASRARRLMVACVHDHVSGAAMNREIAKAVERVIVADAIGDETAAVPFSALRVPA